MRTYHLSITVSDYDMESLLQGLFAVEAMRLYYRLLHVYNQLLEASSCDT